MSHKAIDQSQMSQFITMQDVPLAPEGWFELCAQTPIALLPNLWCLRHLLVLTDVIDTEFCFRKERGITKTNHRPSAYPHHEILAFWMLIIYPSNDHLLSYWGTRISRWSFIRRLERQIMKLNLFQSFLRVVWIKLKQGNLNYGY